ncbi:hypothetical protein F4805DRAFT_424066 [Annulohypoxylon moriforme]|nr:hypothetical protein F4805DRAFT_424066 [Annulohypoxylon moriforme]
MGLDSATLAGVVSTAIAFVTLIVSSVQLLYQYYTNVSLNALGARNCNERVMGPWARFTRRRWRWSELRFETIFESPVLFVGFPSNLHGPLPFQDIWYIDGSEKSYEDTRTPRPASLSLNAKHTTIDMGVNVEATWILLLQALQSMECDSAMWNNTVYGEALNNRTLSVGVQAQRLSWDFIPNFKKPFANTTMSHMVEIAAMLCIYWTMWDSAADRYRAEGNGYILLGSLNSEQNIVFQLIKRNEYIVRNHIIPHIWIKELCFGLCPTFYWSNWSNWSITDDPGTGAVFEPAMGMGTQLKVGSRQEIAETLMGIGCPIKVAEHFLSEEARVSHLFPVIFDVIGMLGHMLSIKECCCRMLPNPTIYRWERQRFDTKQLLLAFKQHFHTLSESYAACGRLPNPLVAIATALNRISPHLGYHLIHGSSPLLLDNLRASIEVIDTYLKGSPENWKSPSQNIVLETVSHHISTIVTDLKHQPSWLIDIFLFARTTDGTNEQNYIKFLFRHSRWAATHEYPDTGKIRHLHSHERELTWRTVGEPPPEETPALDDRAEAEYKDIPWRDSARVRDITWCLLVFRMLCWLQLHDFHRDDVMIPRSATYGSRMPVYII